MQIHLIATGTRMPDWVGQGYAEYARRMPSECRIGLHEITAGKRGKNADIARLTEQEGRRMLAAIPKNTRVIAMDVAGQA
ncbi:MAG TPA: 23S rRNA (pseudouridine(1915)-N(3))-methyltransferase RlmH, partial [Gammaproteobacteria bacterium]|nr:23S rRNA (pseudouridine(1915)-N(3))-methyltransferase RlmH [Gammaproteobacteria bacterium]